jgi:hypothetical protein
MLAVRMGPRVLRTETAGPAALAAMQTLWGDISGDPRGRRLDAARAGARPDARRSRRRRRPASVYAYVLLGPDGHAVARVVTSAMACPSLDRSTAAACR